MKLPLLSVLVCFALSQSVYSQQYNVYPGEYQCFFQKKSDNSVWALGGTQTTMGVGTNTGAIGALIPMQFPAGVVVKYISSGLHGGNAVDVNGNVWFWGLNDGGMRCDGTIGGAISLTPVQITTDSLGNPFTNVSQISSFWWDDGSANNENSSGVLAVKNDGTVWIWGNSHGGFRGNGQLGQENYAPVQITFPGNPHIVKVLAGDICMALDNAGNVYTWGGNGRNTLLGTNVTDYYNVHKVTLPKPAKDIAGAQMFSYALATDGTLYGWGIYGAYLGIGTGPYLSCNTFQPLPVDLTSYLNLPHPVSQIMCNSICTHAILTDSTLWGWGDNTQGNVGNGIQINFATYATPYAWDWGAAEVLQNKPAQIAPLVHNFVGIYAGAAACFYFYAQTATGQLYSWGRNKGVVCGNEVAPATSPINAQYPDAWEQPTITAVNPFAITASTVYLSTSPYCKLFPTSTPCNGFTIPADVAPVSVPGPNQTITLPTTTTILDGSGSHDPDGTVVYYKWRQIGGPSGNTVLDSTYAQTRISGLVAGTYVYRLTVTDNGWDSSAATMTVVVQSASGNVPPTVSAGSAQTIQLPTSSVTLTGTATGNNGATISTTAWTEVSGPVTGTFGAAANLTTGVSGLTTAGTYVFQLKATDNNGLSATATVTITVQAANVPPTVSAGSAQTIQLPTSSVTLTGTASGNGGATISTTAWTEVSGPVTAAIAAATSLSTSVSGLSTAGTYVFQLKATDNHGLSATSTVTITVTAANIAPTVSAGSGQTIQLPVSAVTLSGTATGNGGATISSTVWSQVSGPVTAGFSAVTNLTTGVSGMTAAGNYVFQLKATDNHGLSATSTVTITVQAANVPPTVSAGSAQTIQLPVSAVTLSGTATGNGGATISTTVWTEISGPATASIAGTTSLSTGVSGLTAAGTYVFQLSATDSHGLSATSTVTVTVQATAPPVNIPPTVSAGSDQTIQLPVSAVTLSGTATGNGGATISTTVWTEISGPVTASIAGTTSLSTGVSGLTTAGSYVFELKATDNNGLSTTDAVTITVQAAVPPVNVPPTVNAGSDQTIQLPVSAVTLSGTATGNGGATISTTAWTETSGPVTATIAGAAALSTGVSGLTTAGTYVFELTATDNNGLSATSAVTITVQAAAPANIPPVANAGPDQTITMPVTTAILDGSGSSDADGTITTYSWVQLSGNGGAMIVGANQAQATVTGLQPGTYVFQLTVTDNAGATGVATVTITVQAASVQKLPPVANAGQDTTIAWPADSAVLNGGGSTDPGGEALTYQWAQVSGPSTTSMGSSGNVTTTVSGMQSGLYVFQLRVTDSSGLSSTALVKVRVINNQRLADTGSAQAMVYPNPVESMLTVKFDDPATSGQVLIKIINMKGETALTQEAQVTGGQLININMSNLPRGIYALQVIVGQKQSYRLIVKQ